MLASIILFAFLSFFANVAALSGTDITSSSWDIQACYWVSTAADLAVSWLVMLPQYDGKSPSTAEADFYGSMGDNSACRGPSFDQAYAVGAADTTTLLTLSTSDFCTAFQMTNVIKATTGNVQRTACLEYSASDNGNDPDVSDLLAELFENGDDGDDVKRAAIPMTDVEMATLLQMENPENATHADVIDMLSGPSPIDVV